MKIFCFLGNARVLKAGAKVGWMGGMIFELILELVNEQNVMSQKTFWDLGIVKRVRGKERKEKGEKISIVVTIEF